MCTMYVQKSCTYLHIMCRLRFDLEYINIKYLFFGTWISTCPKKKNLEQVLFLSHLKGPGFVGVTVTTLHLPQEGLFAPVCGISWLDHDENFGCLQSKSRNYEDSWWLGWCYLVKHQWAECGRRYYQGGGDEWDECDQLMLGMLFFCFVFETCSGWQWCESNS